MTTNRSVRISPIREAFGRAVSEAAARDPGPLARLWDVIADPATPGVLLQRSAAGESLGEIAKAWRIPRARFLAWIATQGDLSEQCRRAREIASHELVAEGLEIIDEANPETVAVAKERANYRLKVAKAYHPRVYGEQKNVDVTLKRDIRDYSDEELQRILDERRPPIDVKPEEAEII